MPVSQSGGTEAAWGATALSVKSPRLRAKELAARLGRIIELSLCRSPGQHAPVK